MTQQFAEDRFRGTTPVAYSTNSQHTDEGRTFVWAWTQWFERLEGDTGAVAFIPVAETEAELDTWLARQGLRNLDNISSSHFGIRVIEEFLEQVPLYPGEQESSDEKPFSEQNPGEDLEHY